MEEREVGPYADVVRFAGLLQFDVDGLTTALVLTARETVLCFAVPDREVQKLSRHAWLIGAGASDKLSLLKAAVSAPLSPATVVLRANGAFDDPVVSVDLFGSAEDLARVSDALTPDGGNLPRGGEGGQ
jgi:hypothetical protein